MCNIIQIQLGSEELWPGHRFWVRVHCELDLWVMTLAQDYDIPLSHGQKLFEVLSRSNLAVRSYGLDTVFGMCALWPWPWRYDIGSRSWHTLGSMITILRRIIQIGQVGTTLWPGHDKQWTDRQTDRRTDRRTGWFLYTPETLFAGGMITFPWTYNRNISALYGHLQRIRADK